MKYFLLCLLIGSQSISVLAQTNVGGGIFANTTWAKANSPYIVTSNITVMSTVTLTIQPGVVVKFNNGTNLQVKGYMVATGTPADSILFISSSSNPSPGLWNGLDCWNDQSFGYIRISHATTGLNVQKILSMDYSKISFNNIGLNALGGTWGNLGYINNSVFEYNTTAISSVNSANHISNSSFIGNGIGIGYAYSVLISGNTFTGHTAKAIDGYGADYIGNSFIGNNIALRIKLFSGPYQIKNNLIINNQIGVEARGDAGSTPNTNFSNNTICNNSTHNFQNTDNVDLFVQNNCWCTADSSMIASSIVDAYDNLSLGVVYFSPFISNCSSEISEEEAQIEMDVFPDPFVEGLTIRYVLACPGEVSIRLMDLMGREIANLESGGSKKAPGNYRLDWEVAGSEIVSGIYFLVIQAENQSKTIKVIKSE